MSTKDGNSEEFGIEDTATHLAWWITQTRDMLAAAVAGFPAPVVDFPPAGNIPPEMLAGALQALVSICAMAGIEATDLDPIIEHLNDRITHQPEVTTP